MWYLCAYTHTRFFFSYHLWPFNQMLRNVVGFPVWGRVGCRLLATGMTGTPPGRHHRQKLKGFELLQLY